MKPSIGVEVTPQKLNYLALCRRIIFSASVVAFSLPCAHAYNSGGPWSGVILAPDTPAQKASELLQVLEESIVPPEFNLNSHWDPSVTATGDGGSAQGDSLTLTWSIIPDGTLMPGFAGEPNCLSNLIATFNSVYGAGNWQDEIAEVFDEWTSTTGNQYVYESNDDGAFWPDSMGEIGVRGDIRIGGCHIDGNSGILAYNFYPQSGDMKIDSTDSFYQSGNLNDGFHNVISHEHGHGAGINHVCPINQTKLMEPFVTTAFVGPQHDDIRAIQRH
ncbi:matrix metalloproteinase-26, partial [Candidatus Thiomargarita nelsonii]